MLNHFKALARRIAKTDHNGHSLSMHANKPLRDFRRRSFRHMPILGDELDHRLVEFGPLCTSASSLSYGDLI